MCTDPLARPLGRVERFYWLLDQQSCTNFVLTLELDGALSREDLEAAITRSWARHPRLRCKVTVNDQGTVVFQPEAGGPPALTEVRGPWRTVADAQLLAQFPAGSHPLVRCHWVPSPAGPAAVFTFAHGVLDAGSAAAWLMELLADTCGHLPEAPFPAHPAPSELLYPARYRGLRGLLSLLPVLVMDGLGRRVAGEPPRLPGAPPWETLRQPITLHVDLDAQHTSALVQRCRAQDCTVQGAIMAAQALALRSELPGDQPTPVRLVAAMDLRPWLEPPLEPGTLGNHVSGLPVTIKVEPTMAPAALAAELTRQLRGKIARGLGHLLWKIMPPNWFFPPDERSFPRLKTMGRAAPPSTVVTNLGRLPELPPAAANALRALRFTMAPLQGSPLCTGVATVNGALRMDLCFDDAHLDEDRRARVVERFVGVLEAF